MPSKASPILPAGNSNLLTGLSDNLAFHKSAESFIVKAVLSYNTQHPDRVDRRLPVRAKILNRNVIILSAYGDVRQVLEESSVDDSGEGGVKYVATAPYRQLMEDFFPPPNLLLQDGFPHFRMRARWNGCPLNVQSERRKSEIVRITTDFLEGVQLNTSLDLYTVCKDLAWQLFLSLFLDIAKNDQAFAEIVSLQEDLLRGQFSLLPVSFSTGFWQSPRRKGIDARRKLQAIITERLDQGMSSMLTPVIVEETLPNEMVNHLLMATSSLAVKGYASLLTALLLNMFLFDAGTLGERSLATWAYEAAPDDCTARSEAIILETMRLSPPIVGIMRRATAEQVVQSGDDDSPDTLVPEGWDVWSYFPGANRDAAVYGEDADLFRPDRYLAGEPGVPKPIVFGHGPKNCLGAPFVQQAALAVMEAFAQAGIRLKGTVSTSGVRGWLGWQVASPEQWARDMKQLPTQRPSEPIRMSFASSKRAPANTCLTI